MKIPFYDMTRIVREWGDLYMDAFERVLNNKRFSAGGEVATFEEEFARYCGSGFFRACANGTDALELIYRALEIGPGDEVIVPSFTCWATVEPLLLIGAVPRVVDVTPDNFGMEPSLVQSVITHKTKAVVVAHLFGYAAQAEAIREICDINGILLIEDCAQAHGVRIGESHVGTFGKAAAFSFYPTKNLGALGEAGGILTDDIVLAEKLRMMIDHGQRKKDHHDMPGRNSRMDELQAAFLRIGLEQFGQIIDAKREIALQYNRRLRGIVTVPVFHKKATYHQVVILTDRRDQLKEYLASKGIGTAVHYPYSISGILGLSVDLPVARRLSSNLLSLPSWYGMTGEQVEEVCEAISSFS